MRRDGSVTKGAANKTALAVLAIVMIAVIAMTAMALKHAGAGTLTAVVHASDGSVTRLPLDEDAVVTVRTDKGFNEITVRDGAVFVSDADCENGDCIHQGEIDAPGAQIICLPHELWIEIVSSDDGSAEMDVSRARGHGSDVEEFDGLSR